MITLHRLHLLFGLGGIIFLMKLDSYILAKAGLNENEIHGKQQSLDEIDYMISTMKST